MFNLCPCLYDRVCVCRMAGRRFTMLAVPVMWKWCPCYCREKQMWKLVTLWVPILCPFLLTDTLLLIPWLSPRTERNQCPASLLSTWVPFCYHHFAIVWSNCGRSWQCKSSSCLYIMPYSSANNIRDDTGFNRVETLLCIWLALLVNLTRCMHCSPGEPEERCPIWWEVISLTNDILHLRWLCHHYLCLFGWQRGVFPMTLASKNRSEKVPDKVLHRAPGVPHYYRVGEVMYFSLLYCTYSVYNDDSESSDSIAYCLSKRRLEIPSRNPGARRGS